MMRAAIWKEVREYGKYAALAAVVLAVLLAYLLYDKRVYGQTVVDDTFLTLSRVTFAAFGLALGFSSVAVDRRRGYWGFALHRPVPRWTLFAGKLIGTATLYLAATSAAVAVAAFCATNPRFVLAPFAPAMLLPLLYAQASGVVWLAAGLLIAVREGRWFGTRLFPLATAFAAVWAGLELAFTVPAAALFLGGGLAVLAVAGAGYFSHNGTYGPQSWRTKPASFAVLFAASVCILMALANAVPAVMQSNWISQLITRSKPAIRNEDAPTFYEYAFGPDGQPYLFANRDSRTVAEATAQGVRLTPADAAWVRDRASYNLPLRTADPDSGPWNMRQDYQSFQKPMAHLVWLPRWIVDENAWYVTDTRTIDLQDRDGNAIGSIGLNGFSPPGRPVTPFPPGTHYPQRFDTGDSRYVVLEGTQDAFIVDLGRREVAHALHIDADDAVCGTALIRPQKEAPADAPLATSGLAISVVTRKRAGVARVDGSPAVLAPLAQPPRFYQAYTIAPFDDGVAVLYSTYRGDDWGPKYVSFRGGQLAKWNLPYKPSTFTPPTETWAGYLMSRSPDWLSMPPVMALKEVTVDSKWWKRPKPDKPMYWQTLDFYKRAAPKLLIPTALGVLLTTWLLRRRELPSKTRRGWLIAAWVAGPIVAVTLPFVHPLSQRLPCPVCGKPRAIDADHCPHCAAAWPTPSDPLTDVFERAA